MKLAPTLFALLLAGCTAKSGTHGVPTNNPSSGNGGNGVGGNGDDGGSIGGGSDGGVSGGVDGGGSVDLGSLPSASQGHPFGSHTTTYAPGTLQPSGGVSVLDGATADFYDQWKAKYFVPGCTSGSYYVDFHLGDSGTTYSVSEGHGYGMLIAAIMAGHDPDAQKYFDGLYQFYVEHLSANEPNSHLMGWAQDKTCAATGGDDSATDGDLDIAYALLLADKQWGSSGKVDYASAAKSIIADLLQYETNPTTHYLRLGDWATSDDTTFYYGTRPSDFMLDHFRAFATASGDAQWKTVLDNTYSLIATLQKQAPKTGLLSDFVIDTNTTPAPAPANYLEDVTDGEYAYNSCRVPWHLATDFVMTGDARAKTAVTAIDNWIVTATGGDPSKLVDGYKLDGTTVGTSSDMAFLAPFTVGAMAGGNQTWLDALWKAMTAQKLESRYYEDTLKLLAMIVLSNNWWAP